MLSFRAAEVYLFVIGTTRCPTAIPRGVVWRFGVYSGRRSGNDVLNGTDRTRLAVKLFYSW